MSRYLTDENVILIYEDVILTSDYVLPTCEDVILSYEILFITDREVINSESVTSNRYRIEAAPKLHHWIYWGLMSFIPAKRSLQRKKRTIKSNVRKYLRKPVVLLTGSHEVKLHSCCEMREREREIAI